MSKNIVGIDFSALADFRERVQMKLSDTLTVELPLITLRDASQAELLLKQADLLRSKYAIIMAQMQQAEDATQVGTDIPTTLQNGFGMIDSVVDASMQQMQKLAEAGEQSKALADRVIAFIEPYLAGIKTESGELFIERLRLIEPRHALSVLECMHYGTAALTANDSNDDKDDSPSKKQSQG